MARPRGTDKQQIACSLSPQLGRAGYLDPEAALTAKHKGWAMLDASIQGAPRPSALNIAAECSAVPCAHAAQGATSSCSPVAAYK